MSKVVTSVHSARAVAQNAPAMSMIAVVTLKQKPARPLRRYRGLFRELPESSRPGGGNSKASTQVKMAQQTRLFFEIKKAADR